MFFGGSFDPPHLGHEEIARKCNKLCDKFIFFPCKRSPSKRHHPFASEKHRIQMTKIMAEGLGGKYVVDDFEIKGDYPSYTIDTIAYLKNVYSSSNITMIVGADQMMNINNWKDYKKIIKSVKIICFDRDCLADNLKYDFINMNYNVSSSLIRENIEFKKNNLNSKIYKYIITNKIYSN